MTPVFYDILPFPIIFSSSQFSLCKQTVRDRLCFGRFVVVLGDFPRGENSFLENEKKLLQNPCTFMLYRGKI